MLLLSRYISSLSSPLLSFDISSSSSPPPSVGSRSSLQEADGADLHSELLIRAADVERGDVHDGQARGLLRSVLHHRLAPQARVFLCSREEEK